MKSHVDLDVWKAGVGFVTIIYEITKKFPSTEMYGITSQMRRAAVSIPTNISEGAARNMTKEYIRFLRISQASLSEIETLVRICFNLRYINEEECKHLHRTVYQIRSQLTGLITSLQRFLSAFVPLCLCALL